MGWISNDQFDRDHDGKRNVCTSCGRDGSEDKPLAVMDNGSRVHKDHLTNPKSGLFGRAQK
jgi:hypothetical protein